MAITITNENWFDINYIEQNAYRTHFIPLLNNKRVVSYCQKQLFRSLSYIGLSQSLCESLILNLDNLDIDTFHEKFDTEINKVFNGKFVEFEVVKYFTEEIIPSIPHSKLVLDIGCGRGTLVKLLANSHKFDKIMGCEWNNRPEWKDIIQQYNEKVTFHVVKEDLFGSFVKTYKPDAFVFTWVLHHMELTIQHQYIKNLFDTMSSGARLVILEEGISSVLSPETGQNEHDEFLTFSQQERQDVLVIYDWVTNIFLQRKAMPIPSSNRTMEEWESLFKEIGFYILSKRYIGWPVRDLINPQALFVLEKPNIQ